MRNVNPDQLKLVMTATEYKAHIDSSSDRERVTRGYEEISPNVRQPIVGRETMDEMWSRKEAEARQPKELPVHDVQWRGGRGVRVQIGSVPNGTHGAGLYDSIKSEGLRQGPAARSASAPKGAVFGPAEPPMTGDIQTYVDVDTGEKRQGEGHHRIAAAAALEKETGKSVWIRPTYTPARLPKQND